MKGILAMTSMTVLFAMACGPQAATTAPTPAAKSEAPAAAATPGTAAGKVVETMNSGGYTYVLVDTGSQSLWAAAPETKVSVGDQVSFGTSMPMKNYHSNTLDRTFELVYFVEKITVAGRAE